MISISMSHPKQATRKVISSHQMVVLTSGPQTFQKQAFASSGIRSRFRIGHPIRRSNNSIRKRRIQLPFRRLQARCDNKINRMVRPTMVLHWVLVYDAGTLVSLSTSSRINPARSSESTFFRWEF
jgi:hypothetical protein